MRARLAIVGVAAAISGAAFSALATPCPTAPAESELSGYLTPGFSCTVNDKTISGMSVSGAVDPGFTLVLPLTDANNPGLHFIFGDFVSESIGTISFTITAPSSDPMTGASLQIVGGGANFAVTEMLSTGKPLSASGPIGDSTTFSAGTSLNVTDSLSATGDAMDSSRNKRVI